ncbi:tail fiber domain-containing protein [Pseudomonas sp. NPDC089554]|uniref:tail fiber domain-containing protein n=1 Tax=Pseudomonas sp. NPDC089554 TaxID=3390653 RepID=UPI003D082BF2
MKLNKMIPQFALALAAVTASGAAMAQKDCCPFSDANLKESPVQLQNATSQLLQLKGVEFTWKETQKKDIGLIAQDVQAVYPQLVQPMPLPNGKGEALTVDYDKLAAPLIESIRELNQRIEELEKARASAK